MEAKKPIEGIAVTYKNCQTLSCFKVLCSCGSEYHDHDVVVDSDEYGFVNVSIETKLVSPYSSKYVKYVENEFIYQISRIFNGFVNRVKLLFDLLWKGHVELSTTISMNKEQAYNYAEYLKKCVDQIEQFENRTK